ncbi:MULTISPECIES: archaeal heat shock protein Hsp14 [Haloprofundus]|uniref:archaeal heat shock protein Hsp14 n=1 Tax=Haloprofundus TaxID=1911573 RepID=UPI000E447CAD|nr:MULTISPECIES: archaeal heat shock protein Hsp14 [Haloprofundus]QCJ47096.1 Hsp20/alpha crystallin family protein [Haloprofundus sp. MHR1]
MMRRSNPFDEFEDLFERMSKQFEGMNRQFEENRPMWNTTGISVDVADEDDEFVVTADMPGFEKEDIDLSLSGRTLTLSGSREMARDDDTSEYIRRERRSESVSRTVRLPEEVREDETRATYSNGVLTVHLPKRAVDEGDDSHRIDID